MICNRGKCLLDLSQDGCHTAVRCPSVVLQAPLNVVRFICLEQFNRLFARIGYSRVIIGPPPEPEPCPHGRIGKCADCLTDKSREIMKHMM